MGTTLVTILVIDEGVLIAHVGDSRIYRVRDGKLEQLTDDHSLLNDYIKMKRLTEEEIANFPHKNVIVRALGMKDTVQVDVLTKVPRIGDTYLLCSDGLSGMLTDDRMEAILSSSLDLDQAVHALIDGANEEGGIDNISVILARIEPL
jgi:protein phosphatase